MSSNEILPALSKKKESGWGCYSRGTESLWSLIWIMPLKDPFCYLRKKHPGRWSAPGVLEFLEKPGGHVAKVHREEEPSIGNEVLHVNRTTCQKVPGAPPAPTSGTATAPTVQSHFLRGPDSENELQGNPAIKLQSPHWPSPYSV